MEKIIDIPARIRNKAQEGHVAGAVDIIDDTLGKKQSVINQEQDTFVKEQIITNQEQVTFNENTSAVLGSGGTVNERINVAVTQAVNEEIANRQNGDTLLRSELNAKQLEAGAIPTDEVPTQNSGNILSSGALYNVFKDSTKGFVEDTPTEGSDKLITSDGVAKFIDVMSSIPGVKLGLTDKYGTPVFFVDTEDNFNVPLNVISDSINGLEPAKIIETECFKIALCDNDYNIIAAIDQNDNLVSPYIKANDTESGDADTTDYSVVNNNIDKEGYLMSDCLYGTDNQRVQLLVVSDTHSNTKAFVNAITAADNFKPITGLIHLGDNETIVWSSPYDAVESPMLSMTKPLFFAMGNHEVGTHESYIYMCQDNSDLYNKYIKPSLRFFASGEYNGSSSNPILYYYHDFVKSNHKVRLIVLYPYDAPIEFDTTYWSPITYNSSYANIKAGQYVVGNTVNVPNYTKYSFECVNPVTVKSPTNTYYDDAYDTYPKYKAQRWIPWYSQTQLQWLCNTLNSVPEGYDVIIAQHETMLCTEEAHADKTTRFSNYKTTDVKGYPSSGNIVIRRNGEYYYRNEVLARYTAYGKEIPDNEDSPGRAQKDRDIISQIVNAWQNNTSISLDIVAESHYYVRSSHTENGAFVIDRMQYDNCTGMEVHLNYTFTNVVAHKNPLFISGHNHNDGILRSDKYNQTEVKFLSGVVENNTRKDVLRSSEGKNMDAITAITLYKSGETARLHLTRLGADVTNKIDEQTNTLVKKTNEIIEL